MAFPLAQLMAYWPLDEVSGTRFDVHGTTHLTAYHGVSAAPGRVVLGARFAQAQGAKQYLGCISELPIETGEIDFTLTAWISPLAEGPMIVVGKDADTGRDYALEVSAANQARFTVNGDHGDSAQIESTGPPLVAGAWSFLVASHEAAAQTISIQVNDGPIDTGGTGTVLPNISAAEFQIGTSQRAPTAQYFEGVIDEVGFWKRVLTTDERTTLYNGGGGLPYPSGAIPRPPRPPLVSALRDRLLALPAVTDHVGDRIYALTFPQSVTAPALRLTEIDRVSAMHLRGVVAMLRSRVQIDAVAPGYGGDPYARAHALALAVRGSLETGAPSGLAGFRGALSGIPISGILADDQRERYDADTQFVRVEQDFIVWFHE